MNQDVYIPDYMKTSHDQRFFQALANHITRTSGEIEWTTSGPVVDGVNISYQFMYPPIYGVDEEIEKLNNPKKDRKFITLTVEEIEFIQSKIKGSNGDIEKKLNECIDSNPSTFASKDAIDPIRLEKLNKFIHDNKNI